MGNHNEHSTDMTDQVGSSDNISFLYSGGAQFTQQNATVT
jgi:hypothetical protein